MFTPEDFLLPLEKELRLKVMKTEIDECKDIKALKDQLISCAESLMRYQHLLTKAVEINLMNHLEAFDNEKMNESLEH